MLNMIESESHHNGTMVDTVDAIALDDYEHEVRREDETESKSEVAPKEMEKDDFYMQFLTLTF